MYVFIQDFSQEKYTTRSQNLSGVKLIISQTFPSPRLVSLSMLNNPHRQLFTHNREREDTSHIPLSLRYELAVKHKQHRPRTSTIVVLLNVLHCMRKHTCKSLPMENDCPNTYYLAASILLQLKAVTSIVKVYWQ